MPKEIQEIPISLIDPFPNHPFKVRDDEDMNALIESIRSKGVIVPCLVRPKKDGRYELISGHRRMHACKSLGLDTLRCEVRELSTPQATIIMVESNFQRDTILPSEKAFSYKMRLEAMKKHISRLVQNQKQGFDFGGEPVEEQLELARSNIAKSYGISREKADRIGTPDGRKRKDLGVPVGHHISGMKSRAHLSEITGESQTQIQRYIRLTELIPELLDIVDEGKIGLRTAVELSYINKGMQKEIFAIIDKNEVYPSHAQAIRMRKLDAEGNLAKGVVGQIMVEAKPNQKERIVLSAERFEKLFPKNLPEYRREEYVEAAMEYYARYLQRKDRGQER